MFCWCEWGICLIVYIISSISTTLARCHDNVSVDKGKLMHLRFFCYLSYAKQFRIKSRCW